MKKILSAKLNSYLTIQALYLASKAIVAVVPALETAFDALIDFILEINLNVKIQASPSGAAEAKKDALIDVGDLGYEVAGGVLAYADKNNDLLLAAKAKFSRTAITAGSSNAVVARIQGIIDVAAANIDSLADHCVTPEKLKALKQKLKVYDTLRVLPRDAIGAAAAATIALDRLFPQLDRLLSNQIDRLMWQFRNTEPDFYNKYQTARSIVDAPTPTPEEKQEEESNVVPVTSTTPTSESSATPKSTSAPAADVKASTSTEAKPDAKTSTSSDTKVA